MRMQIVGISQRRAGTAKNSGKPYDGTTIFCIRKANEVVGQKTEEIFMNHLSLISFPEVSVGDIINVGFDRNGFMEEFDVIERSGKTSQNQQLKVNS